MLNSDASTAKTLTLVAIIFQLIFAMIGVIEAAILIPFLTETYVPGTYTPVPVNLDFSIVLIVFSISLLFGILWVLLDYFLIYRKLKLEKVKETMTPSLILGIIQLIFGGFIPGILLIIAYVKIKDSVQRSASSPPPAQ